MAEAVPSLSRDPRKTQILQKPLAWRIRSLRRSLLSNGQKFWSRRPGRPPVQEAQSPVSTPHVTVPHDTVPHGKPVHQSQSSLLGRLPLEIRELIFQYALVPGPRFTHPFVTCRGRLDHYLCNCVTVHSNRAASSLIFSNPLHLLLTCRHAYIEGIVTLYKHNTFCFGDGETLRSFSARTPSYNLDLIRSMQLPWARTYLKQSKARDDVNIIWYALDRMPNLREVRVVKSDWAGRGGWLVGEWRIQDGNIVAPWDYLGSILRQNTDVRVVYVN